MRVPGHQCLFDKAGEITMYKAEIIAHDLKQDGGDCEPVPVASIKHNDPITIAAWLTASFLTTEHQGIMQTHSLQINIREN